MEASAVARSPPPKRLSPRDVASVSRQSMPMLFVAAALCALVAGVSPYVYALAKVRTGRQS